MPTELDPPDVAHLFREHGAMVYRRAWRILGNRADAEEATQEVFVRVMRGAAWTGKGDQVGWLYKITTHYCLNQLRNRGRRRELFEERVAPVGGMGRTEPAAPSDLLTLRWLLHNADPRQAQTAVYVYLDGLSHREAAELMGVSKRTVGNLLDRFALWAQAQLAARVAEEA